MPRIQDIDIESIPDSGLVLLRGDTVKQLLAVLVAVDRMRGGEGVLVNHGDGMIRVDRTDLPIDD